MKKDGVIYKGMSRYRTKFLIINILLTVLFIMYTVNKLPYLKTAWTGPSPLDTERFLNETGIIVVDEFVDLGRKDRKTPDASYLKKTSYWQDDKYRFEIKADSVTETDVTFKGKVTAMGSTEPIEKDMYKLYIAEIGGRKAAVLAYADQKVSKDMTACIVHMQKPVLSGVSQLIEKNGSVEICDYIIDVRGHQMEAEDSDHSFFWIYLAGLVFLYIKLIRYYLDPRRTPTYRQLLRFGNPEAVEEEIDRQAHLPSARRGRKEIILDNYILTRGFMKLIVARNHMAKH